MRFSNSKALAALLVLAALFLLAWWRLKTGQYIVTPRAAIRNSRFAPALWANSFCKPETPYAPGNDPQARQQYLQLLQRH
jgi:hypothetical protein